MDFREKARDGIIWVNNIEKDEQYKRFHPSRAPCSALRSLCGPAFVPNAGCVSVVLQCKCC